MSRDIEINISKIADTIADNLKEYTADIEKGLQKDVKDVAKEASLKLRDTSPKKTGAYSKGWGSATQDGAQVVRNKDRPYLTHLLEKGHAKTNGGRTKAIVHIATVEQWAVDELTDRTEKRIKNDA